MIQSTWEAYFSAWRGVRVRVADDERDIQNISIRTDGRIWVETSRGWLANDTGVALTIDEFNQQGQFVRQVTLCGEISAAEDFLFVFDEVVLRVTTGTGMTRGWLGARSDSPGDDGARPTLPSVICYQMTPME
jgi:hypothetical protein